MDTPNASPTSSLDQREASCTTPVTTTKAASGLDIASLRVGVQVTICGTTRPRGGYRAVAVGAGGPGPPTGWTKSFAGLVRDRCCDLEGR